MRQVRQGAGGHRPLGRDEISEDRLAEVAISEARLAAPQPLQSRSCDAARLAALTPLSLTPLSAPAALRQCKPEVELCYACRGGVPGPTVRHAWARRST